jgi:hypothetical protein
MGTLSFLARLQGNRGRPRYRPRAPADAGVAKRCGTTVGNKAEDYSKVAGEGAHTQGLTPPYWSPPVISRALDPT